MPPLIIGMEVEPTTTILGVIIDIGIVPPPTTEGGVCTPFVSIEPLRLTIEKKGE